VLALALTQSFFSGFVFFSVDKKISEKKTFFQREVPLRFFKRRSLLRKRRQQREKEGSDEEWKKQNEKVQNELRRFAAHNVHFNVKKKSKECYFQRRVVFFWSCQKIFF